MTIPEKRAAPSGAVEGNAEAERKRPLLHPFSGALILGLDWVLFSGTLATGGAGLWASSAAGFVLGGLGTAIVQRRLARDSVRMSVFKGVVAGVVVGAPFPVAGTVVGGLILGISGLDKLKHVLAAGKR